MKNKKGYNIYKNAIRYFSYPSSIKPLVEMEDKVRFPKGSFHLKQHFNLNSLNIKSRCVWTDFTAKRNCDRLILSLTTESFATFIAAYHHQVGDLRIVWIQLFIGMCLLTYIFKFKRIIQQSQQCKQLILTNLRIQLA